MRYAGTDYIFEKNILGDVVAIYNMSTGAFVGGYTYDAWGNVLATTGNTVTNANPFRYRGYYYDTETSMYYLNSRYYDPQICRFISPDNPANLLTESSTSFGANLYQYAYNNPVMYTDANGEGLFTALLISALVFGLVNTGAQLVGDVINCAITGQWNSGWEEYLGAFMGGVAGGAAFVASGFNLGATFAVMGGIQTLSTGLLTNATGRTNYSGLELLGHTAFSAGIGYLGGKFMGGTKIAGATIGRNSYMATFKAGLSKLANPKVIYTMSAKVFMKGVAGAAVMRSGAALFDAGIRTGMDWLNYFMGKKQGIGWLY